MLESPFTIFAYADQAKPFDRRAALASAGAVLLHGAALALLIFWVPRAAQVTPPKLISVELVNPSAEPQDSQTDHAQTVTEIIPRLVPAPAPVPHLQPLPTPIAPTVKMKSETSTATADTPTPSTQSETNNSAASAPAPADGVFDPGRPLSRQEPVYPDLAARHGLTGMVELRFTILADGSTDNIRVVKSEPSGVFDEAALHSQRTARYAPAKRGDTPVDQPNCRVIFHFQMPR